MDKATIMALLEKYWQAETSVEEEAALAKYFREADVDRELQAYIGLFGYFDLEAGVSAGPGFGDRILQRLGLPAEAAVVPVEADAPVVPMARKQFKLGIVAAAAAIMFVVAGLSLLQPAGAPVVKIAMTDTYEDPAQALAAVRHALLIASHHLNQGRHELTGGRK
jgi:hypothetical protein